MIHSFFSHPFPLSVPFHANRSELGCFSNSFQCTTCTIVNRQCFSVFGSSPFLWPLVVFSEVADLFSSETSVQMILHVLLCSPRDLSLSTMWTISSSVFSICSNNQWQKQAQRFLIYLWIHCSQTSHDTPLHSVEAFIILDHTCHKNSCTYVLPIWSKFVWVTWVHLTRYDPNCDVLVVRSLFSDTHFEPFSNTNNPCENSLLFWLIWQCLVVIYPLVILHLLKM